MGFAHRLPSDPPHSGLFQWLTPARPDGLALEASASKHFELEFSEGGAVYWQVRKPALLPGEGHMGNVGLEGRSVLTLVMKTILLPMTAGME